MTKKDRATKIKAPKAGYKARTTRPEVVSFRITATQARTLNEIFNRDLASGVNSRQQLARKVLCDYLAGRLRYRNPADKLQDFDAVGA